MWKLKLNKSVLVILKCNDYWSICRKLGFNKFDLTLKKVYKKNARQVPRCQRLLCVQTTIQNRNGLLMWWLKLFTGYFANQCNFCFPCDLPGLCNVWVISYASFLGILCWSVRKQVIRTQRKPEDSTGLTLQNFTWIWSKFIVYTGHIYKIWNQRRGKKQKKKQTLDTTEVLAKSIYRYVIY